VNILEAIEDPNLFQPFLGKLDSWQGWMTALYAVYGSKAIAGSHTLNEAERQLILDCTGRPFDSLPATGFDTTLFLTGRRSGKSRTAAVIGAFEAALAGHEKKLAKGETGKVVIVSPSKPQSRIVRDYIKGIFDTPLLQTAVHGKTRETKEGFLLTNGVAIDILAGDWRTVRGFTLLAAIVDEAAFFGYDVESKVKSDSELIRALKPALATIGGKLIAITTPYAQKGWCYSQWKRHHGNPKGKVLVWNCPSRTMNPTLPQSVVDEALAEDLAAAKAEYLGEFRDDVASFLPREVVEQQVVSGRRLLLYNKSLRYVAFVDISGGRADDAVLAIGHNVKSPDRVQGPESNVVVIDRIARWRPPFNPHGVCREMVGVLSEYGITRVTGDNYSAEFTKQAFESHGIKYTKADKPKSQLYIELLPRLCSGEVELLDDSVLIDQIAGLERRTRSGGRDSIDHGPGQHDDVANAVAGVVVYCTTTKAQPYSMLTGDGAKSRLEHTLAELDRERQRNEAERRLLTDPDCNDDGDWRRLMKLVGRI
jgi:Terminase large subunit, T4likevirus-type, N-terminal